VVAALAMPEGVGRRVVARVKDVAANVFWRSCRRLLLVLLLSFVDDDDGGVACREVVIAMERCWAMEEEDEVGGAKADADARIIEMEEKNSFIVRFLPFSLEFVQLAYYVDTLEVSPWF